MVSQDEKIVRLLTDTTNRSVLTILNGASQPLSVTELAEHLVREDEGALEQTILSLHHNHLPQLAEAGVIQYDRSEHVVTEGGTADWVDIDELDTLFSQLKTEWGSGKNGIGLLEGREEVYDYGRELADTAEEELFLIYASDELLNEDCLPPAKEAIDRGVQLHAGTKSQEARGFFRECLPEATIWDPQMDWMYEQSNYPKVSRLIFADRDHVVVGLWNEDAEGTKTEIAMIGEGKANPLVVLSRELLGPRLDHLDYQSDNFLGSLPFET